MSINNKDEQVLRLIFELTSLVHPTKTYIAKKTYKQGDSQRLIDDLEHLFDGKIEMVVNLSGEIIPEALSLLLGKDVDIEIEHLRGKNHEEPYCLVTQVRKAGVLIEQLRDAA